MFYCTSVEKCRLSWVNNELSMTTCGFTDSGIQYVRPIIDKRPWSILDLAFFVCFEFKFYTQMLEERLSLLW